jgi:hypothetical protein
MDKNTSPAGTNDLKTATGYIPLNSRKEPLTPQKLRELTGDDSINDEEAAAIIGTIRKLNTLFLELSRLDEQQLAENARTTLSIPTINPFTQNKAA